MIQQDIKGKIESQKKPKAAYVKPALKALTLDSVIKGGPNSGGSDFQAKRF